MSSSAVPPPVPPPPGPPLAGTSAAVAVGAGGRLARHSAWSVVGAAVPLGVGIVAIPIAARALGVERFGLLGLAWALLEHVTVFDVGLGRALIYHVSRELGQGRRAPSALISGTLGVQLLLGALLGALLVTLAPAIATGVLRVPPPLAGEAARSLVIVGLTMPFVLLGVGLRGLLDAAERFDLAARIRVPSTAATFVIPAVAAPAGASLPTILALLLAARIATCVVTWLVARRAIPGLALVRPSGWTELRGLLGYGRWVAVSNVVTPLFFYFDRLVLGALVGVAAVGYYLGPFEVSLRLLTVPAALAASVFPIAAGLAAAGETARLRALHALALRGVLYVMLPAVLLGIVLAPHFLPLWLGAEYAARGVVPFRLLLAGTLVTALAHVPSAFLLAVGLPRAVARIHLATLAVHLPATLLLVAKLGLVGAALSWVVRVAVDATLHAVAVRRALDMSLGRAVGGGAARLLLAVVVMLAPALLVVTTGEPAWATLVAGTLAGGLGYAAVLWRLVLTAEERVALARALGVAAKRRPPPA